MAFGDIDTTQVQDDSCCVIVNTLEASLDFERTDDGSTGERRYRISGDIITKGKKHCIQGPTLFTPSLPNSSLVHRGAVVDCIGGEYPKADKAGEVKPLVQWNCKNTVTTGKPKLDMFAIKWLRCAKPCSEDISEVEDCPEFVPPSAAPGWEFTETPTPKCCCEKETKIPIDVEVKFNVSVQDITGVFGGIIGVIGNIVTDSEGQNVFDELVPMLKGKLGMEIGCACKPIGRPRSLGMPDIQGNDPELEDVLGRLIPGVSRVIEEIQRATTVHTTLRSWNVLPGGGAAETKDEGDKKPTVPRLDHTPCGS